MSQDFTDDCFASDHVVQTDMANIEKNFAALKSGFSGAATPSNLIAGMWWFDKTTNILKLRNEANNAWQSVWDFANNKPVITNLSNEITGAMIAAAIKDPAAGTYGLRRLGTTALKACAGNDARLGAIGDASVSQAKLKTSMGNVSTTNTSGVLLTLPGGTYGFYPQIKSSHADSASDEVHLSAVGNNVIGTSYATRIWIKVHSGRTVYAQQRYVTASGEVHWIFILRDKITKKITSMYQAPDHPCFGNGGKPLLLPHPFGDYNEIKHEIIVINPSLKEIEQMESETIVDDEMKSDKDLLEVITENYKIDENSNPAWPTKAVTVGLPKYIKDKKDKKILADYRFMGKNDIVEPIKKIIPKPDYIKVKTLKRISHA